MTARKASRRSQRKLEKFSYSDFSSCKYFKSSAFKWIFQNVTPILLLYDKEDFHIKYLCPHNFLIKIRASNTFPLVEFKTLITLFIIESISEGKDFDAIASRCKNQCNHLALLLVLFDDKFRSMSCHSHGTIHAYRNVFHQSMLYLFVLFIKVSNKHFLVIQ